jgi:hypothetical protein
MPIWFEIGAGADLFPAYAEIFWSSQNGRRKYRDWRESRFWRPPFARFLHRSSARTQYCWWSSRRPVSAGDQLLRAGRNAIFAWPAAHDEPVRRRLGYGSPSVVCNAPRRRSAAGRMGTIRASPMRPRTALTPTMKHSAAAAASQIRRARPKPPLVRASFMARLRLEGAAPQRLAQLAIRPRDRVSQHRRAKPHSHCGYAAGPGNGWRSGWRLRPCC